MTPWIALIHVRPKPGSAPLGAGAKGAYAHVLALAQDAEGYADAVRREMAANDLLVIEIDDAAPLAVYEHDGRVHGEVAELAETLSAAYPVQYKTFEAYYADDG